MFEWTGRHECNYNKLSDKWKRLVISCNYSIRIIPIIDVELIIILIFIVNNPMICCRFRVLSVIFIGKEEWWANGRRAMCVKKYDEFFALFTPYIHPETTIIPQTTLFQWLNGRQFGFGWEGQCTETPAKKWSKQVSGVIRDVIIYNSSWCFCLLCSELLN